MSTTVFLAVLAAALLHAVWNSLVKGGADKLLTMSAVVLGQAPIGFVLIFIAPMPDTASWSYIAAGIFLHVCYQFSLMLSYRAGDFTQVYPIARGTAPMLVAGVSVVFLNVHLSIVELSAVAIIALGILSLSLVRQGNGLHNHKAGFLAFLTGCFIAAYSLVDGYGARAAGTTLGFYAYLTVGNAIAYCGCLAFVRPSAIKEMALHAKRVFVIGGCASFIAYTLVLWAFTQAPIALVTALRESSIIFALLIGLFFLKERVDLAKVLAITAMIVGAVMLRLTNGA